MRNNRLTTKDKWENVWTGIKLPHIQNPVYDIKNQLNTYLPKSDAFSLIEIGCAPGGWMAYFNKQFGYRVSGIEYAEAAAATTILNMEILGLDKEVIVQDFFTFEAPSKYDIVFSSGFIEHFKDSQSVVEKICHLSRRYVITIVPNCYGINGFISRTIRPVVFNQHIAIDIKTLNLIHTNCGIKTLFCDYVGGVRLILPGQKNNFFTKHKHIARIVNSPVQVFNLFFLEIGRLVGFYPRTRLFSNSIIYIGLKDEN
ncbi:MAG: class I SAM-dependent methyltransferase [Mariniphaga sp.]|nr:class I SAM-dependent methyltransferase [Mariniphaga sp.]